MSSEIQIEGFIFPQNRTVLPHGIAEVGYVEDEAVRKKIWENFLEGVRDGRISSQDKIAIMATVHIAFPDGSIFYNKFKFAEMRFPEDKSANITFFLVNFDFLKSAEKLGSQDVEQKPM